MPRTVDIMSTAVQKISVNFEFNLILEFKGIFGVNRSSIVKTYPKPPRVYLSTSFQGSHPDFLNLLRGQSEKTLSAALTLLTVRK